eukprot:6196873-Pleurochrysis_carterae.AAC.1
MGCIQPSVKGYRCRRDMDQCAAPRGLQRTSAAYHGECTQSSEVVGAVVGEAGAQPLRVAVLGECATHSAIIPNVAFLGIDACTLSCSHPSRGHLYLCAVACKHKNLKPLPFTFRAGLN